MTTIENTTSPTDIAAQIVEQMSTDDIANFTADKWREGVGNMLVGEWEGADVAAVLAAIEEAVERAAEPTIAATNPRPSTTVDGGMDVDITVTLDGTRHTGTVTLTRNHEGEWSSIGDGADCWVSPELLAALPDEGLRETLIAIRDAASEAL